MTDIVTWSEVEDYKKTRKKNKKKKIVSRISKKNEDIGSDSDWEMTCK